MRGALCVMLAALSLAANDAVSKSDVSDPFHNKGRRSCDAISSPWRVSGLHLPTPPIVLIISG